MEIRREIAAHNLGSLTDQNSHFSPWSQTKEETNRKRDATFAVIPRTQHNNHMTTLFEIKYTDGQQKPYEPMRIPVATRFFEKFSIPNGMDPTVQVISELFLPDSFLARVVKCLNLYGKSKGHPFKPISAPDILVFFSIIFYMGVV